MRFRQFNTLVLLFVMLLAVANYLLFEHFVNREIDQVLINTVRQNLYNLSLHLNEHLNDPHEGNMHILLDRFNASSREVAQLYIVDERGNVLLSTDYGYRHRFTPPAAALDIDRLDQHTIAQADMLRVELYKLDGLRKVPYTLYVKLDRGYISGLLSHLRWVQILFPLTCLLLFLGGYYLFYRLVIRPILRLDDFIHGRQQALPKARIREIEDLSENIQHYIVKLKEMAYIDPLTQVQNRRSIDRALELAIAGALRDKQIFTIAALDLDHFKTVNDTYGHDIGDKLLQEMTRRIQQHLRQVDQIGRLGGDEFLIIFHHDEHPENILQALERIRLLFEEPFIFGSLRIVSTLSVGVATFPSDGSEKEQLLKNADAAMYRAKKEGGNRIR